MLRRTQSPVSKLTERHSFTLRHWDRQSARFRTSGRVLMVSVPFVPWYAKPVTTSKDASPSTHEDREAVRKSRVRKRVAKCTML